jgi:hypothetical protein
VEANQLNTAAHVQPISEEDYYKINKLYSAFLEEDGVPHGIHAEALISMFTTNMIEVWFPQILFHCVSRCTFLIVSLEPRKHISRDKEFRLRSE